MKTLASVLTLLFIPVMAIASDPPATGEVSKNKVIRLSDPVSVTETHEVFGALMPSSEHTLTLSELIANSEQHLGEQVVLSTQIVKVCQKKDVFSSPAKAMP